MPRVHIDINDILHTAVKSYQSEVEEITDVIRSDAAEAGVDPEPHYPPALVAEHKALAEVIHAMARVKLVDVIRVHGQEVPEEECRVMVSALLLKRDDLEALVIRRENDPLAPADSIRMLRGQIREIDGRLEGAIWARGGASSLLPQVRERRAIRRGLAFPRPLELSAVRHDGEGQEIEFMSKFPDQAHDLAKEVSAFGSSNPGTIWLGVAGMVRSSGWTGLIHLRDATLFTLELKVFAQTR